MFRYDASSKVSESSFNEFVGDIPTKYTDRFSVLARFGKHKVALIADISKAFFLSVGVRRTQMHWDFYGLIIQF